MSSNLRFPADLVIFTEKIFNGNPTFFVQWGVSFCLVKLSKMESITDESNTHFINDKDLEILVVASIQNLKRGSLQVSKRFA